MHNLESYINSNNVEKIIPITPYRKALLFGYSAQYHDGEERSDSKIPNISTEWSNLLDKAMANQTQTMHPLIIKASTKQLEQALSMLETALKLFKKHNGVTFDTSARTHWANSPNYKVYRSERYDHLWNDDPNQVETDNEQFSKHIILARQNILLGLQENHYRDRISLTQNDLLFIKNNLREKVSACQSIDAVLALYKSTTETQSCMLNYQQPFKLSTLFSSSPRGELKNVFLKLIQAQAKVVSLNNTPQYQHEKMQELQKLLTQEGIRQKKIATHTERPENPFNNGESERSNNLFPV